MLILQALFLWLLVSTLLVGGAMVFHHYFPEESPWFGFIVPPLALVVLCNFIEHGVALPSLVFLLPPALAGTIWLAFWRGFFPRALWLPAFVFLATFAFTFAVRSVRPDISPTSDGISDLNMVNNFYQGQTLPPPDAWMPPYRFEWYYDLQHYAASVLGRILDVKVGVAYNVSHALLSSLICVAGAGAAYRFSGGRTWITLAVPFLIEASATGSSAYVLLFGRGLDGGNPSVWLASDLSGGMTDHNLDNNPLFKLLDADPRRYPIRLQVPGFWTWRDEYHANASGHFLTLLSTLVISELTYARRTIWPWVLAMLLPFFAATASAWALPITVLLCWGILPIALVCGRRPAATGTMLLYLFGALTLIWPAFYNVASSPEFPEVRLGIPYEEKAPLFLFVVQWWPILLLWICACVRWRDLSFGARWIMLIVPVMLLGIDHVDIESRYNMIEKMWGYTWGAALITLFPIVAARAGLAFRFTVLALLVSATISLGFFINDVVHDDWNHSYFHLEGNQYLQADEQKRHMLQVVTQTKGATYLSGKCAWCYNEAPTLAVFTGNKSYIAWFTFESLTNFRTQAVDRSNLDNDFYSGAMTDRLRFLQDNKITGVLIWPDDDISNDFLDALKKELDPAYNYFDCKGGANGAKNAGVFLRRPQPES